MCNRKDQECLFIKMSGMNHPIGATWLRGAFKWLGDIGRGV